MIRPNLIMVVTKSLWGGRSRSVKNNCCFFVLITGFLWVPDNISPGVHSKTYATQERHKKPSQTNYYTVLGVTPKATSSQIKLAYYKLSKIYHPDRNKSPTAPRKFQEVQTAYETLSNPKLRAEYDGISLQSKIGPRVQVKHPWKKASHPTGRSNTFNFDEHVNQHYSYTLKLHRQIKEDAKEDREMREAHGFTKEEHWVTKLMAAVLMIGIMAYVIYYLPKYESQRDHHLVTQMMRRGKRTDDNSIIAEDTSR